MLTLQEELEVFRGEGEEPSALSTVRVFPRLPFPLGGSLGLMLGTAWILFQFLATLTPVLPESLSDTLLSCLLLIFASLLTHHPSRRYLISPEVQVSTFAKFFLNASTPY